MQPGEGKSARRLGMAVGEEEGEEEEEEEEEQKK